MADEVKKKKTGQILRTAAIAELVLAVAVIVWGMMKGTMIVRQRIALLGAALVFYWFLTDFVEPVLLRRFANRTMRQRTAYVRFALFDLLGYAGILCFLSGVGGIGGANRALLGGVLYVVSVKPKRENQKIFYGEEKTESDAGNGAS